MDPYFRMLHVIGFMLWASTIAADIFLLPAAKASGALQLKVWGYRIYSRMLMVEVAGLALLVSGAVGMLVVRQWWPWEFRWLLIKFLAGLTLIFVRLWVYALFYRYFYRTPFPSAEAAIEVQVDTVVKSYDRYSRTIGVLGVPAFVLVIVMVFWKPLW